MSVFNIATLLLPLLITLPLAGAAPQDTPSPAGWREDIAFLERQLPARHGGPAPPEFGRQLRDLAREIDGLPRGTAIVRIAAALATFQDSHTELPLAQPAAALQRYPLVFYQFAEGLHLIAAPDAFRSVLGGRLVAIGGVPSGEVVRRLMPLVAQESDVEAVHVMPEYLTIPEALHAFGVGDASAEMPFELQLPEGNRTVHVRPAARNQFPTLVTLRQSAGVKPPLARSRPDTNHWFTLDRDSRVLYLSFASSSDQQGKPSIGSVVSDFFELVDRERPERVVIDLRLNSGGNMEKHAPLLDGIARRPWLRERGRLYVLVGRATYSAGLLLATELRRAASPIMVGETPRGLPNRQGEVKRLTLPRSGLAVSYSSSFHRRAPDLEGRLLPVDIVVPAGFAAYAAGVDEAYQAAVRR